MSGSHQEFFETFTEAGEPLGLVPRTAVHARGLWHKSVHIFVYDGQGRLYVQRRAANKDIAPGLWDLSAAEHLKPGESFIEAACRGLDEELGIRGPTPEPLGSLSRTRLDLPDSGIRDYELQQAFRITWPGPVRPDSVEIAEIRALTLARLRHWMERAPGDFTPWFLKEVRRLGVVKIKDLRQSRKR